MAKYRVALVLSGGVSLGSYIAGALDELLRAMQASGDYVVDVIVGASAGATTAGIIAHGLLYTNGETRLHEAWVKRVDMEDLLAHVTPSAGEPVTLLSNASLGRMAEDLTPVLPAERCVPSPLCAESLTLGMTITNLEGLSYISRVKLRTAGPSEPFIQLRFAEQETFQFNKGSPPDAATWARLRQVCLASSALPLVFPPVPLRREVLNRSHYLLHQPAFEGGAEFLYVDGGVFNNLPIDLAAFFAGRQEVSGEQRIFIVVDPSRDEVKRIDSTPLARSRPLYSNTLLQLGQLLGALRAEGSAVQFENEMLDQAPSVRDDPSPEALPESPSTGGAVSEALPTGGIIPEALPRTPPGAVLPEALPGFPRPDVKVLENFRLVLPSGTPPLKGSYLLYALSAFLDEQFREYDFRRGAADARRLARDTLMIAQLPERPGEPLFYDPDADARFNRDVSRYENLGSLPSSRVPNRSVREVFEAQLRGRLRALAARLDLPGPRVLNPLYAWVVERMIVANLPQLWRS